MDLQESFDASGGFASKDVAKSKVHIRVQQRHGKKALTTIAGLPETVRLPKTGRVFPLDFEKILKAFKIEFQTNGALIDTQDHGRIIQLQGDIRKQVADFLVEVTALITKDQVLIHGS